MLSHKDSNSALRARLLAGHTPNTRLTRQRTGSTQLPTSASPPAHACSRQAVTPRAPRAALEPATHGPGQAQKQLREGFPQMWHPRPCCPYPPPTCPEQEHCCENRRLLSPTPTHQPASTPPGDSVRNWGAQHPPESLRPALRARVPSYSWGSRSFC